MDYTTPYECTASEFEEYCKNHNIDYRRDSYCGIPVIIHKCNGAKMGVRLVKFDKEFFNQPYIKNTWTDTFNGFGYKYFEAGSKDVVRLH